MRTKLLAVCVLLAGALGLQVFAEDFKWSWEDEAKKPAAESGEAVAEAQPEGGESAQPKGEGFGWSWDKQDEAASAGPQPGVEPSAYNELIRENTALRKQLGDVMRDGDQARRENARLTREIGDLESRIEQSVTVIGDLQKQKAGAEGGTPDKMMELESKLADAETAKAKLGDELAGLRKQLEDAQTVVAVAPAPAPAPGIKPGSDLFRQIQKENTLLKTRIVKIEKERQKALKDAGEVAALRAKASAKEDALEREVAESQDAVKQHRRAIKKLLRQMPSMEKELAKLRTVVDEKDAAIEEKDRDAELLRAELDRREHRMVKAERMAGLLDDAREEVKDVYDREKRDMHFNMAVVYAKEERFRDAEMEYLRALSLDPGDADVHYNLGIIYEDHLDEARRAAMHYRRYLKLRPHAEDIDAVRQWLITMEGDLNR